MTTNTMEERFDKIFKCNCYLCQEKGHPFSTTRDFMVDFIRKEKELSAREADLEYGVPVEIPPEELGLPKDIFED